LKKDIMGNLHFLSTYVYSCASGKLAIADCSVVWQMLVIIVLLVLAVSTLIALRIRGRFQTPAA
jgi:hypothetical protein